MIARIIPVLVEVGVVDGKADEALFKALGDRVGIRRAVAAVTLWRGHASDGLPAVRKLLTDKDLQVRRRVALELAVAGDQDGAVVLSGLLEELPDEQAWEIEEQLERLAGGKAPAEHDSEPDRLEKSGRRLEAMVAGRTRQSGHDRLLRARLGWEPARLHAAGPAAEQYRHRAGPRRQAALDSDRASRPLRCPGAGQSTTSSSRSRAASPNATSAARCCGNWREFSPSPSSAWPMVTPSSPATVCSSRWTALGKDILRVPVSEIVAARRLPDRRIVAFDRARISSSSTRPDERSSEFSNDWCGGAGCNEVLDNGHVLALSPGIGNITEFDMEGKEVGRFEQPGASHGFRLPNGHTLVTVDGNQVRRAGQELEADQRDDAGGTGLPRETTLVFSRHSPKSIDPTSELTNARPGGEFYEPSILSCTPDRGVAGGQFRRGRPGWRARKGPVEESPVVARRAVEPRVNPDGQDQSHLIAARLPTDNAGLVHFLDLRARGEPAQGTLDQLIETLAGSTPEARFQACADLVAIGTPALPRLRALVREGGKPADVARRCLACHRIRWGNLDQCRRSLAYPAPYR